MTNDELLARVEGLTGPDRKVAALSRTAEPVAWRVQNDAGEWHYTTNRQLVITWTDFEKLTVEPLYALEALREALTERAGTHGAVLAVMPDVEVFTAADVRPTGLTRKQVFNALAYLCRRGDLAKIGRGKYQRPPDFRAHLRLETTVEHIDRDMSEGRFPEQSEPQYVNPASLYDPASEAAYFASIWQLSTPKMRQLEEAFRRARAKSGDGR